MTEPLIRKGETVQCAKCHAKIALITRDLFTGAFITESIFSGIQYEIKNGQLAVCNDCGYSWSDMRSIHLERGWVPNAPSQLDLERLRLRAQNSKA